MSFEDDEDYMFRQAPYIAGPDTKPSPAYFYSGAYQEVQWSGPNDHRTMMIPQGNETQIVPRSVGVYTSFHQEVTSRPSELHLLGIALLCLVLVALAVVGWIWWFFVR